LEVEVVGVPAAGEHGVQLLSGLLTGHQAVHGVGGDALRGMDGSGIAETGRGRNVVGWQLDGELAAVVPDGEVTAPADAGDGPAVAVLDPVGGGESEPAVVGPGDDHISDTALIAVGQVHLPSDRDVAEAMITGTTVEFGDQVPGGGEHDGIKAGRSVGNPSGEGSLCGGGEVADVDATVIKIEVERLWLAFAEGE
jgi:hypothetical protein